MKLGAPVEEEDLSDLNKKSTLQDEKRTSSGVLLVRLRGATDKCIKTDAAEQRSTSPWLSDTHCALQGC